MAPPRKLPKEVRVALGDALRAAAARGVVFGVDADEAASLKADAEGAAFLAELCAEVGIIGPRFAAPVDYARFGGMCAKLIEAGAPFRCAAES